MTHKLTILGMSLLVVCAFGAQATSAHAGEFRASEYPATVTGGQIGEITLTTKVGTLKCEVATFTATLVEKGAESLGTEWTYEGCTTGGVSTDVNFNGCNFEYRAGNTINGSPDEVEGTMEVKCPAGKKIEFTYTGNPDCTTTIPPQKEANKVTFTNKTAVSPMDVQVDLEVKNLHYTLEGKGCIVEGTFNDGQMSGSATMTAIGPLGFTVT